MIEDVGCGQLEPEARLFAQLKSLRDAGIEHHIARPDDDALGRSSEVSRLRRSKCGGVKPPTNRSLARRQIRVTQNIRTQRDIRRSTAGSECGSRRVGTAPLRCQK